MKHIIIIYVLFIAFFHTSYSQKTNNSQNLQRLAERVRITNEIKKADAYRVLSEQNLPLKSNNDEERQYEINVLDDQKLYYFTTYNSGGASLIKSSGVYSGGGAGLDLSGNGITLGIWDSGRVRAEHQELVGRVNQIDGATTNTRHATHVAGTLMASGVNASAKGMSYASQLHAYDWNFDTNEMIAAAMNGLNVSQHSYGFITGWAEGSWSGNREWHWFGNTNISEEEDYFFGFYDSYASDWDELIYNAPYYLIVKSAGNDRGKGPNPGASHYFWDSQAGSWQISTATRETGGGVDGYDCISHQGVAKNIISVGAVSSASAMTSFSSWGPTDDGRVKPDIVAKGLSVYSTGSDNNSHYYNTSGTSMSGPMISGSIGLLLEHQNNLHPGTELLASTIKGLILHSADDMISGHPGPDYRFGWGLMDTRKAAEIMSQADVGEAVILEEDIFNGDTLIYFIQVETSDSLRASLVWTDVPGTPTAPTLNGTTPMLVNDLDMRIWKLNDTFSPYVLDPSNPSSPATTGDNFRDNVEVINISQADDGIYTLRITHKGNITDGPQSFSLIITGGVLTPCPLLAEAPTEVEIINSTCQNDCSVLGGQILEPLVNPCPLGSTLQYRNDMDDWSTTLPIYDQDGPSQKITTRCVCDELSNEFSPISEGKNTLPGLCRRIVNSNNEGPGSLRHAIVCADTDDILVYDLPTATQTLLTQELIIDKPLTIMGMLDMDIPTINIDFTNMSGAGINISDAQVVLENIRLVSQNNTAQNPLLNIGNGGEVLTRGLVEIDD